LGAKGYEFKSQFLLADTCIHLAGNNAVCMYTAMDHCGSTSQLAFVTLRHPVK